MKYLILLLILVGCGDDPPKQVEENYIPPTVEVNGEIFFARWGSLPVDLRVPDTFYDLYESELKGSVASIEEAFCQSNTAPCVGTIINLIRDTSINELLSEYSACFYDNAILCSGQNELAVIDDGEVPSGSLAFATYYFGVFLIESDVVVDFNNDYTRFDLQSVLTHEFIHFLGIGHSASISDIMYPFFYPNQIKGLGAGDISDLRATYPEKIIN